MDDRVGTRPLTAPGLPTGRAEGPPPRPTGGRAERTVPRELAATPAPPRSAGVDAAGDTPTAGRPPASWHPPGPSTTAPPDRRQSSATATSAPAFASENPMAASVGGQPRWWPPRRWFSGRRRLPAGVSR